jgi:hypothetical protein|tara:strand:+ start:93 stop:497 length:405 start_codon:yes stop_codon:yes gene_type:complete
MKQWLKKVTGIEAEEKRLKDEAAALEAKEMEQLKVRDPKAYATKKKEPWVNVLDVKVNQDNVRNGFFELDWNKYFIEQLIGAGYGEKGDPEEQIVDRWFKDIVYNMFIEEGMDTDRGAGYINVVPIDQGKSEVS